MKITAKRFYFFGLLVGISAFLKGKFIIGLKRILLPVAYWRYPIFPIVYSTIQSRNLNNMQILDIGSPKLLALYLSIKHDYEIYATDIQDKEIWNTWYTYYQNWLGSRKGNYKAELQDARKLTYQNEVFNSVFSISVIEHIPDNGDMLAMAEIGRVLKFGGIAIIEVPYAIKKSEIYVNRDVYERKKFNNEPVFYQRTYDDLSLTERLINPSKLILREAIIIGEKHPFENVWERVPNLIKFPLSWTEALISKLNHFRMNMNDLEKDKDNNIKRAMSITLVLGKSAI